MGVFILTNMWNFNLQLMSFIPMIYNNNKNNFDCGKSFPVTLVIGYLMRLCQGKKLKTTHSETSLRILSNTSRIIFKTIE